MFHNIFTYNEGHNLKAEPPMLIARNLSISNLRTKPFRPHFRGLIRRISYLDGLNPRIKSFDNDFAVGPEIY